VLQPASDMNDSLDLSKEEDAAVLTQLNEVLRGESSLPKRFQQMLLGRKGSWEY
jgi:hypothetical protein